MRSPKALTAASLACLAAAVVLCALFLERLGAAAWQGYKFAGYSDDGHITLSLKTGWIFTAALSAVFLLAHLLNRAANRPNSHTRPAWSRSAMYITAAVIIGYWALGMSHLNVWRP